MTEKLNTIEGVIEQEVIKPVAVKFDNMEPGFPGVTIEFSDGTKQWFDAKSRRQAEDRDNLPIEERIDNLPPIVE